jgi:cytochrome c5
MRKLFLTSAVLAVSLVAGHALAGDQPGGVAPAAASPAAASPASAPPPGPGLDLINDHCKFCHVTAQVFAKKRSADEWGMVIQTMIDRGAELSPEETKVITDYLTAHYGTGTS